MISVKRAVSPSLNPAGLMAAAGAVYAAALMIVNAVHGHGVIDPAVIVAAVAAASALLTRTQVTPVADPKNGAGQPLVPDYAPVPAVPPPGTGSTGTVTVIPPPETHP